MRIVASVYGSYLLEISDAVAHLLQGSVGFAFRDALLHTLVLTNCFGHCSLPISLKNYGH